MSVEVATLPFKHSSPKQPNIHITANVTYTLLHTFKQIRWQCHGNGRSRYQEV